MATRPFGHRTQMRTHKSETIPLAHTQRALLGTSRRAADLSQAAAQVIGRRTAMMMLSAGDPVAMGNPEFTLMAREKIEAFAASGGAMLGATQALHGIWIAAAAGQVMGAAQAWTALLLCRTPAEMVGVYRQWFDSALAEANASASRLLHAAATLGGTGLDPIHRVASANARRIGRR